MHILLENQIVLHYQIHFGLGVDLFDQHMEV